jgi:methylmalonyl-CoA carboxyltransferase small subunit
VKLKITVDNKTYEVDVEAAEPEAVLPPRGYVVQPAMIRVPAMASPPSAAYSVAPGAPVNEEKVCRSPINGVVIKVLAQPGQSIQPGDILLVLEAMKMETNLTAPRNAVVRAINVKPGDSVKVGQVLVEFE